MKKCLKKKTASTEQTVNLILNYEDKIRLVHKATADNPDGFFLVEENKQDALGRSSWRLSCSFDMKTIWNYQDEQCAMSALHKVLVPLAYWTAKGKLGWLAEAARKGAK